MPLKKSLGPQGGGGGMVDQGGGGGVTQGGGGEVSQGGGGGIQVTSGEDGGGGDFLRGFGGEGGGGGGWHFLACTTLLTSRLKALPKATSICVRTWRRGVWGFIRAGSVSARLPYICGRTWRRGV